MESKESPKSLLDKLQDLNELNEKRKARLKPEEKESQTMEQAVEYSEEFKKEAVRKLVEGHRTYANLSKQLNIDPDLLRQWRQESPLKSPYVYKKVVKGEGKGKRKGHRTHSVAFKRKCVRLVVVGGMPYTEAGKKMDVHPNQISQWNKIHNFTFKELNEGPAQAQAPIVRPEENNNQPIDRKMTIITNAPLPKLQEKYMNDFAAIQEKIDVVVRENAELRISNDHITRERADLIKLTDKLEAEITTIKREHNILKQAAAIFANDVL